jgi:hypothetical protein
MFKRIANRRASYGELRDAWSKAAGQPLVLSSVGNEQQYTALTESADKIIQTALRHSDNNVNLTSSNLFTNALDPVNGCPPILALAQGHMDQLVGVKSGDAAKLLQDLKSNELDFLVLLRSQLINVAIKDVEGDEMKNMLHRQVSNPLLLNSGKAKCRICFDDFDSEGLVVLRECGHEFCKDCLHQFVLAKESEGAVVILCPLNECKKAISQRELMAIVGTSKFEQLDKRALERIVAQDPTFHMCPTPDCSYIVWWTGETEKVPAMLCPKCGHERCLRCGVEPYHYGKSCQQVASAKTDTEMKEMVELLKKLNFRPCPRCKTPIEKIDGCNKMLCFCGCKFCSVCFQVNPECWHVRSLHGYHHPITGAFVSSKKLPTDLEAGTLSSTPQETPTILMEMPTYTSNCCLVILEDLWQRTRMFIGCGIEGWVGKILWHGSNMYMFLFLALYLYMVHECKLFSNDSVSCAWMFTFSDFVCFSGSEWIASSWIDSWFVWNHIGCDLRIRLFL